MTRSCDGTTTTYWLLLPAVEYASLGTSFRLLGTSHQLHPYSLLRCAVAGADVRTKSIHSREMIRWPFHSPFFLRIRPPPGSTLFPYTTLFRSTAGDAYARDDSRSWLRLIKAPTAREVWRSSRTSRATDPAPTSYAGRIRGLGIRVIHTAA